MRVRGCSSPAIDTLEVGRHDFQQTLQYNLQTWFSDSSFTWHYTCSVSLNEESHSVKDNDAIWCELTRSGRYSTLLQHCIILLKTLSKSQIKGRGNIETKCIKHIHYVPKTSTFYFSNNSINFRQRYWKNKRWTFFWDTVYISTGLRPGSFFCVLFVVIL